MKEILSKTFDTKQTTLTFLVNIKKIIKNKKIKIDDLTVFEPKHSLEGWYDGTDALPLSQTATFNIICLKWDLKDSFICLDLAYFRPKIKTEK